MFKDELVSSSDIHINNPSMVTEKQTEIDLDFPPKTNKISEESILYLDLFTSKEISPYFIVSFREYILVVNIHQHPQTILCLLSSLLQLLMNHSFKSLHVIVFKKHEIIKLILKHIIFIRCHIYWIIIHL